MGCSVVPRRSPISTVAATGRADPKRGPVVATPSTASQDGRGSLASLNARENQGTERPFVSARSTSQRRCVGASCVEAVCAMKTGTQACGAVWCDTCHSSSLSSLRFPWVCIFGTLFLGVSVFCFSAFLLLPGVALPGCDTSHSCEGLVWSGASRTTHAHESEAGTLEPNGEAGRLRGGRRCGLPQLTRRRARGRSRTGSA